MKSLAYLRVSKDSQDVTHQRLAVLESARQAKREIDDFMEVRVSSRRSPKERQLDILLARLEPGDTLIVSELSRMGRSVGETITLVDTLVKPSRAAQDASTRKLEESRRNHLHQHQR